MDSADVVKNENISEPDINNKKPKKTALKKVIDIVFYVVVALIIVFALVLTVMSLSTKDGITRIFGYIPQNVLTDSMKGEFSKGDLIISKECNPNELEVGDIISFYFTQIGDDGVQQKGIVTHRIAEIDESSGSRVFLTHGDAAERDAFEEVLSGDVISKYTGKYIPKFGSFIEFLDTDLGFILCIMFPLFLFLFWQAAAFYFSIRAYRKDREEKLAIENEQKVEEQAKALAEKMLKQMQASTEKTEHGQEEQE